MLMLSFTHNLSLTIFRSLPQRNHLEEEAGVRRYTTPTSARGSVSSLSPIAIHKQHLQLTILLQPTSIPHYFLYNLCDLSDMLSMGDFNAHSNAWHSCTDDAATSTRGNDLFGVHGPSHFYLFNTNIQPSFLQKDTLPPIRHH